MSNLADKPTTPETPNAAQMLKDFIDKNNMEIRLSPPIVRNVDGSGILIEQPQVIVDFKKITSIEN